MYSEDTYLLSRMYINDTFNVHFSNNNCTLLLPVMYIDDFINVHCMNNNSTLMIPLMYIEDTVQCKLNCTFVVCFMYIQRALR
jgi:hypothetical protein